jgi:hypothetical protein
MDYNPIQDYGPVMKGMVIGGLGIFHVFLAQMAIGGGMILSYFEWLRRGGRSRYAARFIDGFFQALVLVSFVLGALTGVAMWFTAIQVSPRTIGVIALVVREARRLAAIDITTLYDAHRSAASVGGREVFLAFFAINAVVIIG